MLYVFGLVALQGLGEKGSGKSEVPWLSINFVLIIEVSHLCIK
jgi:hypothetical protein